MKETEELYTCQCRFKEDGTLVAECSFHREQKGSTRTDLDGMQNEVEAWSKKNFPNNSAMEPLLGIVEEVGELSHAVLKQRQNIRGTPTEHELAAQDAIGDLLIYVLDYCGRRGWSTSNILAWTWKKVQQRDWKKDATKGGENG